MAVPPIRTFPLLARLCFLAAVIVVGVYVFGGHISNVDPVLLAMGLIALGWALG